MSILQRTILESLRGLRKTDITSNSSSDSVKTANTSITSHKSSSSGNPLQIQVYTGKFENNNCEFSYNGSTDWDKVYNEVFGRNRKKDDDESSSISENESQVINEYEIHNGDGDNDGDDDNVDDSESNYDLDSVYSTGSEVSTLSSASSINKKRSSDEELKFNAMSKSFTETAKICRCQQPCSTNVTLNQVSILREDFWGNSESRAPSSQERGCKIRELLKDSYVKKSRKFEFKIKNLAVKDPRQPNYYTTVCEGNFIIAFN